jgi:hypothetical protein
MAISTDQKMSWVIGIEIHDYIGVSAAMNNKSFFITHAWDFAEWTGNFITCKRAIFSTQIIKAMWSP